MNIISLEKLGQYQKVDQILQKFARKSLFQLTERKAEGAWRFFVGSLAKSLKNPKILEQIQEPENVITFEPFFVDFQEFGLIRMLVFLIPSPNTYGLSFS